MEIINDKYEIYLKTIADNSIDFVCIDPPYTDNKGNDVLKGHARTDKRKQANSIRLFFRLRNNGNSKRKHK